MKDLIIFANMGSQDRLIIWPLISPSHLSVTQWSFRHEKEPQRISSSWLSLLLKWLDIGVLVGIIISFHQFTFNLLDRIKL